jgi:S-(hydroxymethyl)glutathione dehydrogenase / alcohol dehydrogenase
MKAAVFYGPNKPLEIEDVEISTPGPREVLINTKAVGLCHSDLHFLEGSYPHPAPAILGHESAGVVEAVGSAVNYVQPGDHVITILSPFCGHCDFCLTGRPALCVNPELKRGPEEEPRLSKGGEPVHQFLNLSSFAEKMLVHEHALVKVRKDMPFAQAALLGCGVTTGVGSIHNTAKVEVGSKVVVIGCGGVGLSCINGADIAGAGQIIAVDTQGSKLDLAKKFGATDVVNASEGDPVAQVQELTGGGAHYSFEAIGLKATSEQAFAMLRRGGTATIIGMIPIGTKIEFDGFQFLQEKKLQGSFMGSNRFRVDMPNYVEFYMQGKLHLDDLISQTIKLEQINDAFEELKSGALARSVISFE